ncbi:MAG: hypothetical protein PHN56_01540 [Candidatus Nanoarchaeia archaeon]|nr:hypothetical protein [Candidatus Nanoarchaeia archaeon]
MKERFEYIKNGLKNTVAYISLIGLEKIANNYCNLSYKIKDISGYLNVRKDAEEINKELYDWKNRLSRNEAFLNLKGIITKSKKKFIEDFIEGKEMINENLLSKYCIKINKCVEDINKKNNFLNKIKFKSESFGMYYNQLLKNIEDSSENLFEKVNNVSELINENGIIPSYIIKKE